MRIEQLMAKSPKGCPPGHPFSGAAQMIWDHDCGYLSVTAGGGSPHAVGTI